MTTGRITMEVSEVARLRADAAHASELSGKVARYEAALRAIVEAYDQNEGWTGPTLLCAAVEHARGVLR